MNSMLNFLHQLLKQWNIPRSKHSLLQIIISKDHRSNNIFFFGSQEKATQSRITILTIHPNKKNLIKESTEPTEHSIYQQQFYLESFHLEPVFYSVVYNIVWPLRGWMCIMSFYVINIIDYAILFKICEICDSI